MEFVNLKMIRNQMTLASKHKYSFFPDAIFYKGYYCISSVAKVKETCLCSDLKAGQTVITSPIVLENMDNISYRLYKISDIDIEEGLLIPVTSCALEVAECIVEMGSPVYIENNGLLEMILIQILKNEGIKLSKNGMRFDLQNPLSWKTIVTGNINWRNYDSLANAEILLKNGIVELDKMKLPHAHTENINFFIRTDICNGVIFDW